MRAALPFLLGRHDFASFQNAGTEMESTVRELQAATLTELPPVEFMPPYLPCLRLTVTANGFLKQMVRNMAGLLAACGRHKLRPDQIPAILEAADRRALPSPRPRRLRSCSISTMRLWNALRPGLGSRGPRPVPCIPRRMRRRWRLRLPRCRRTLPRRRSHR